MYSTRDGKVCVIYIRVSSERQVKGYSLEGQKRYLCDWAKRQGMKVVKIYVEEGKSGKSIDGRTEFQEMLDDIKVGNIRIDYVVVFKLSRFGRNARDVLNSLEFIMKYGVHLLCESDGLDSSTSMGKMMITILGAVAELERDNIITQSLLGREEKARKGGWNGGFAPYGYKIDKEGDGLLIDEGKREAVQLIFNKFLYERVGITGITGYLNSHGYIREPAPNATEEYINFKEWTTYHVKRILDNPTYCGRVSWGRRRTEKVVGEDNTYKLVQQDDYIMSDNVAHEGYVTEEEFEKIQEIRDLERKKMRPNFRSKRTHILSGVAKCPNCGASMFTQTEQWTNRDGTKREKFTYVCGYYLKAKGTKHCNRNGVSAERLEKELLEYTSKLMKNPQFAQDIQNKIGKAVDLDELQLELSILEERLKKLERNKANLVKDIDGIQSEDKIAERKRKEFNKRLDELYNEIYSTEGDIEACRMRICSVEQKRVNLKTIYKMLNSFDEIYARMDNDERCDLIDALVKEVTLFKKDEQAEQKHLIKEITYSFPIEEEVLENLRHQEAHVETIVSLQRQDI